MVLASVLPRGLLTAGWGRIDEVASSPTFLNRHPHRVLDLMLHQLDQALMVSRRRVLAI
jgi:hypothetical protein